MSSQLRIVGGSLRGRKLPLSSAQQSNNDLRPTGDRIRETVFNWLQGIVNDADCVDCFTGSGALAIEAISRGARSALAFDTDRTIIQHLQQIRQQWQGLEKLQIQQADALQWLSSQSALPYHIFFVDPPFRLSCQQQVLDCICAKPGTLKQWVYLEMPAAQTLVIPANAELLKDKTTGQVRYMLVQRHAD